MTWTLPKSFLYGKTWNVSFTFGKLPRLQKKNQNDVNELFHAISDADASTQYLMQNYEKMLAKEEHNIEKNETSISIKEEIDKEEHDEMER